MFFAAFNYDRWIAIKTRTKKETAVILRDPEIRAALHLHLKKRRPYPARILEEVGIHNGNAIADLVAFYGDMHCFEIKGATDSIRRVIRQGEYYNEAFSKISLVTTQNHLTWCLQNIPPFWGVMLAYMKKDIVKLKYARPALHNPFFCKEKALLMLWKNELSAIANTSQSITFKSRHTRQDMAVELSKEFGKTATLDFIRNALLSRQRSDLTINIGDMAG